MIPIRALVALGLAAGLASPQSALALTLQEAIALAQRGNPTVAQSASQVDAAEETAVAVEAASALRAGRSCARPGNPKI